MHPFGATLAEECVSLFMYDARTLALETQAHVPTYAAGSRRRIWHLPTHNTGSPSRPCNRGSRPSAGCSRRPNHLWHLDAMLAAYPDARVIWTHRDPGPVGDVVGQPGERRPAPPDQPDSDPRPTANEWRRKCAFALRSAMSFDENARDTWCQHLHYDALMADPVGVRRLYTAIRRGGGSAPRRRMHAFLEHRPQDRTAATAMTRMTSGGPTPSSRRIPGVHPTVRHRDGRGA